MDCLVSFLVVSYCPATRDEPACGGGLEDLEFKVTNVKVYGPGDITVDLLVPKKLRRAWEQKFLSMYESLDGDFRHYVDKTCYDSPCNNDYRGED